MYTGESVSVPVSVCAIIKLNWEEISFNWIAFKMNLAKNPWLRAPFIYGFCALLMQTLPSTSMWIVDEQSHIHTSKYIVECMCVIRQKQHRQNAYSYTPNKWKNERTKEQANPWASERINEQSLCLSLTLSPWILFKYLNNWKTNHTISFFCSTDAMTHTHTSILHICVPKSWDKIWIWIGTMQKFS